MRSKGMSFIKFGLFINILMGAILLIAGVFLGAVGLMLFFDWKDAFLGLIPAGSIRDEVGKIFDMVKDNGMSYKDAVEKVAQLPDYLKNIFEQDLATLFMGFGFGLAGYAVIIHIAFSAFTFKRIAKARRGEVNFSRMLALLLGILSLIPFAFPGVLILIGSFGKKPIGTRSGRRHPYGPRLGGAYRRPPLRY